jgi:hypothetical protein
MGIKSAGEVGVTLNTIHTCAVADETVTLVFCNTTANNYAALKLAYKKSGGSVRYALFGQQLDAGRTYEVSGVALSSGDIVQAEVDGTGVDFTVMGKDI